MTQRYVSQQMPGFKNHLEKVAIVGAGGQVGRFIVEEMLKIGRHQITAITRTGSTNIMAAGVNVKRVDYDDQSSLVRALEGQDALIITMGFNAPPEQQTRLIEAAAAANVPWVLPNEYVHDHTHPGLCKDAPVGNKNVGYREHIERLGQSSWIGIICGCWYEFSLGGGTEAFGFDFKDHAVTFYDDGNTRINTSTWPQTGRSIAELLSLKILPDDDKDTSPCLSSYKNRLIYISSFSVNQKDILDSVLRVTDTKLNDWKINYEPTKDRYKAGMEEYQKGFFSGLAKLVYSRVFYQDGSGNYERSMGLQNEILGLPKENMDEYTKIAVQLAQRQQITF